MSAFTDYTEAAILNHIFRNQTYHKPVAIYVAMFTANPGENDAAGTECSYTGYARRDAADAGPIDTGWTIVVDEPAGDGKQTTNAKTLTFAPNNGPDNVTVTHIGLYDAATNGNLLFWAELTEPKTLQSGDVLSFLPGDIVVVLD